MATQTAVQPQTAPVAQPATSGPDRLTTAIGIAVVVLVVIGIAVAATAGRGRPQPDLTTPEGVALSYELYLQRGEADRAWELLANEAQLGTTRQEFLARAAGLGRGPEARFSIQNVRMDGSTTHLDLVRTLPTPGFLGLGAGSSTVRHPVTLVRENNMWRISVPSEPYVIMQPVGIRP
jgi:hypothetical protein